MSVPKGGTDTERRGKYNLGGGEAYKVAILVFIYSFIKQIFLSKEPKSDLKHKIEKKGEEKLRGDVLLGGHRH